MALLDDIELCPPSHRQISIACNGDDWSAGSLDYVGRINEPSELRRMLMVTPDGNVVWDMDYLSH